MTTALLIDIDGTCHAKGRPIPGAAEALAAVQAAGCAVRLLTNVDSRSGEMVREELNAAGFRLAPGQVYSAIDACVAYLHASALQSAFCLVSERVRPLFAPWLGDDRATDIAGANAMGWESVLVHTGKYALQTQAAAGGSSTWELESIADLPQLVCGLLKGSRA